MATFARLAVVALLAATCPASAKQSALSARRGFLTSAATALCTSAFIDVAPCQAGYVTNLGFGEASQEDAEVDRSALTSGAVQADLKKVQSYAELASKLNAKYQANPQVDIKDELRAFDRADLRTALNSVNNIFGEDFQKQTDRMVRNIIQDLSELDSLAPIKEGSLRSKKKIVAVDRFIVKLDKDLQEFLKFVPSS